MDRWQLPSTETELGDLLSRPSPALVSAFSDLESDIAVFGAGGKMGPGLARMARRALDEAGRGNVTVYAVSRWSDPRIRTALDAAGVRTVQFDLSPDADLAALPDAANIVFAVGAKFGTEHQQPRTWMTNAVLPALVANRYPQTRVSVLSTGNVYPLVEVASVGCSEDHTLGPIGEYAMSCLGRERAFEYAAESRDVAVSIVRLNYAVEPRYGVLSDIATKVASGDPVDVTTGHVNVVWQRYASDVVLRCLEMASVPPFVLNLTGPETVRVRHVAERFGKLLGTEPKIEGLEATEALLSNASRCHALFGYPDLSLDQLIEWQAAWLTNGGPTWDKPTKFQSRDGRF